jgi:hypothetical protein
MDRSLYHRSRPFNHDPAMERRPVEKMLAPENSEALLIQRDPDTGSTGEQR